METDGGRPGGEPPSIHDGKNYTVLNKFKAMKKFGGMPRDGPPCICTNFYWRFGHAEARREPGLYNTK